MAARLKTKRSAWRGGPPADGAATSSGDVCFTVADIQNFADCTGLPLIGNGAAVADILNRSVAWYVVVARMQAMQSERASASEWGVAVAEWASMGRRLLGDKSQTPHCRRASVHLCSASQPAGSREEALLANNVLMATGMCPPNSPYHDDCTPSHIPAEIVGRIIEQLAYTLRALELMGPNIRHSDAQKKKQFDYARLGLIRSFGIAFKEAFPGASFSVITRQKMVKNSNERGVVPDGPAVKWCRAVLTTAPERMILHGVELMHEVSALKDWAARTDALPIVIRKLNVKGLSKSAKENR